MPLPISVPLLRPHVIGAVLPLLIALTASAFGQASRYSISIPDPSARKIIVKAVLPVDGTELNMDTTRPGDVDAVGNNGWPEVIRDLKVTDDADRTLSFARNKDAGWKLAAPYKGSVHLEYSVDLSALAAANWPAPREAGYGDATHFIFAGRACFITSAAKHGATIDFSLPTGWYPVVPWNRNGAAFVVNSVPDLVENLLVVTSERTDVAKAGSFTVSVTPLGHWESVRTDVTTILKGVIPRYVRLFGSKSPQQYSVVLLPVLDQGGEAYRASFAYTYEQAPTVANRLDWGHIIAHEIFHYWNGYRLAGADYPSSQWFQEGFTDYMADISMRSAGLIDEDQFLSRIDSQLDRYSRLTTPLARPGSHKGPPLYGGGALLALCWDIQIRTATHGKKSLLNLWPALWRRTKSGTKPYTWDDIRGSLNEIAPLDWDGFYKRYIDAREKLPLDEVLRKAGLKIVSDADGTKHVQIDPNAGADAVKLRKQLLAGR